MTNKIFTVVTLAIGLLLTNPPTLAQEECTPTYGGGQICVRNKNFLLEKKVRLLGQEEWQNEARIDLNQEVEFKLVVKNTGAAAVDDFKVEDYLPEELVVFESDTAWEIDNFKPGDINTFTLKARVNKEKIQENQEKCVVNVVKGSLEDKTESSAVATVCIQGSGEVLAAEKLPETAGLESVIVQLGAAAALIGAGLYFNRLALRLDF